MSLPSNKPYIPPSVHRVYEQNIESVRIEIDLMNEIYEQTEPYTYKITKLSTGEFYVGCQYGLDAHPENLGSTYFTSGALAQEFKKDPSAFSIQYLYRAPFTVGTYWERAWKSVDKEKSFINGCIDDPLCINGKWQYWSTPAALLRLQWHSLEDRVSRLELAAQKRKEIDERNLERDLIRSKQAKDVKWKLSTSQSKSLLTALKQDRKSGYKTHKAAELFAIYRNQSK